MRERLRCAVLFLLCASMSASVHAQQSAAESGIRAGHEFALELCSACHVVASDQRKPPIYKGTTPSFAAIANQPGTTAASLHRFVRTTHPTLTRPLDMPAVQVTDYQLDEIVAYILSLRRTHTPRSQ